MSFNLHRQHDFGQHRRCVPRTRQQDIEVAIYSPVVWQHPELFAWKQERVVTGSKG